MEHVEHTVLELEAVDQGASEEAGRAGHGHQCDGVATFFRSTWSCGGRVDERGTLFGQTVAEGGQQHEIIRRGQRPRRRCFDTSDPGAIGLIDIDAVDSIVTEILSTTPCQRSRRI